MHDSPITVLAGGVGGPDWDVDQLSKLIAYRDQHNGAYAPLGSGGVASSRPRGTDTGAR